MLLRFMRQLGVLLLLATLAVPATMADAATHAKTRKGSHTSVGSKAKPAKGKSARAKSRGKKRGRRGAPPAGGVYARNAIQIDPATGEIL